MVKVCCVDGCAGSENDTYFKLPNSRTQRKKWLDVITTSEKLSPNSLICNQHFSEDQYEVVRGKTRLKAKVIPSKFVKQKSSKSPSPPKLPSPPKPQVSPNSQTSPTSPCPPKSPHLPNSQDVTTDTANNNTAIDNKISIENRTTADTISTVKETIDTTEGEPVNISDTGQCAETENKNKENGHVQEKIERVSELCDTESEASKDIEDILINYHIYHGKQTESNRVQPSEKDETRAHGDNDVIEIHDEPSEPKYIEISTDKGRNIPGTTPDCLMVLENVQVEVDPGMFPVPDDVESTDSDVVDLGEKKDDPISLLTSSDEDEVIIEEPKIDIVEVSDVTDEDDIPLVKLVNTRKRKKPDKILWQNYEYYCVVCHYTTENSTEFKKHKSEHSTVIEICSVCNYTTASKSQFTKHKRTHKYVKRYQCHICEYKAKHNMSLVYHMKTHNKDKVCEKCGYHTKLKGDLTKHVKKCRVKV